MNATGTPTIAIFRPKFAGIKVWS